jgi:hypothetical protein
MHLLKLHRLIDVKKNKGLKYYEWGKCTISHTLLTFENVLGGMPCVDFKCIMTSSFYNTTFSLPFSFDVLIFNFFKTSQS